MSFKPVFSIVSSTTSAIFIKDETPTNNVDGYGSQYAPADVSEIISVFLSVKKYTATTATYGTIPSPYTVADLDTSLKFSVTMPTGVYTVTAYYGILVNTESGVTNAGLSILVNNAEARFAGATHISIDGITLNKIVSILDNFINVTNPIQDELIDSFNVYFKAELNQMDQTVATKCLAEALKKIGVCDDCNRDLDGVMLKIELKAAAEYSFSIGDFASANTSLDLICDNNFITSNCSSCD